MNGEQRERDRRGWHVGKDIPAALILTLLGLMAAGVTGYNRVTSSIEVLTTSTAISTKRIEDLSSRVSDSRVPFEVNAARISVLEANVSEIKARIAQLESHRQ